MINCRNIVNLGWTVDLDGLDGLDGFPYSGISARAQTCRESANGPKGPDCPRTVDGRLLDCTECVLLANRPHILLAVFRQNVTFYGSI